MGKRQFLKTFWVEFYLLAKQFSSNLATCSQVVFAANKSIHRTLPTVADLKC